MNPATVFLVFAYGLLVGSFVNVLIYRLPRGFSIARGRSQCTRCRHTLRAADLVPLASWIALGGRCRYCGSAVSPRYPAVEAANALLWAGVALRFGPTVQSAAMAVVCSCLLAVAFIDWEHMIIPDSLNLVLAAAGLVLLFLTDGLPFYDRMAGAVCVSGPLLLIALVSQGRAMGGGDIKLTAALGLCLGWRLMLLTLFFGAVGGTLLLLLLRGSRLALGRQVPFGTFLAAGGILAILAGEQIIGWYLSLILGRL
jgi:leader peptidase (prepilin peptidase)/N-methyltransferase